MPSMTELQDSDANYVIHQTSDQYQKKKRNDVMDTICNYVLGQEPQAILPTPSRNATYANKFQSGQAMKIMDYWRCLKEINNFLTDFPLDKSILQY